MKIGIYGSGKAAKSIGLYFKSCGLNVIGYYSRDPAKSKIANDLVGCENYFYVEKLIEDSDIIILAVSDDAIENVSRSLNIYETQDKVFCHLSGSLSSDSIKVLSKGKFSIHPIQTLIGEESDIEKLRKSKFTIEGDRIGLEVAAILMNKCKNEYRVIDKKDKISYHYALTVVSNYITSLLDYGNYILEDLGFEKDFINDIFKTLTLNSIENYINDNSDPLTGPAVRGDIETLKNHFNQLESDNEKKLFLNLIAFVVKYLHKRDKYETVEKLIKFIKDCERK